MLLVLLSTPSAFPLEGVKVEQLEENNISYAFFFGIPIIIKIRHFFNFKCI
jgi:uncharacterized membrane protein